MKPVRFALTLAALLLDIGVTLGQQDGTPCGLKGGIMDGSRCILHASVEISIEYPIELAQNSLVAETIDPFIETLKDDFLADVGHSFGPNRSVLDVQYEQFQHSDKIASLVFEIFEYAGYVGAVHGYTHFQTFTFELGTNKVLTLDDLLAADTDPFSVIAPLVEAEMTEQMGQCVSGWLGAGQSKDPANYQHFALDQDSLRFYFDDYQVASYLCGRPLITIPLSQLRSILKPELIS